MKRCSLRFPCGSAGKESIYNVGDLGSIAGLGRSPAEGKGYPLQYSGLKKSMNCIVHGVAKSQTLIIREMQIKITMRYHFKLIRMASIKNPTNNKYCRRCGKKETLVTVGKKAIWCSHYVNSTEAPHKTRNRTTIWSSNSISGYIFKENETINSKRYMYHYVHSSTIYRSQDAEATHLSINRQMDKNVCVCVCIHIHICVCIYVCIIEYYSAIKKNQIMLFSRKLMGLQSIMLSEIS